MAYPGKALRLHDQRARLVEELQSRLFDLGCVPIDKDGDFGRETFDSVCLFQTQRGLTPDGVVGPATWFALFPDDADARTLAPTPLLRRVLEVAKGELGVRETSRNRGPRVDPYVVRAGLDPAGRFPWCMAFVYWCFDEASKKAAVPNPCVKTAGVIDHWVKTGVTRRITSPAAFDNPKLVQPGFVFVIDHGGGKGHTGFVESIENGTIVTIEGNTNVAGSREGVGVLRGRRTIGSINTGFISYKK